MPDPAVLSPNRRVFGASMGASRPAMNELQIRQSHGCGGIMTFRKPFKAVPLREAKAHRERRLRTENRAFARRFVWWAGIAIVLGTMIGFLTAK